MSPRAVSNSPPRISRLRFVGCVFLPYAAGYFLSAVFRSINAVIAGDLAADFHLNSAALEVLAAVFFLAFAAAQISLAFLSDRLEPSFVQSMLMLVASLGALIFAEAQSFTWLVVGRGLIGLGVAATLTVALKGFAAWMPPERVPLVVGIMVMFGGLGVLTAAGPADAVARAFGWRALFAVLAALIALSALAVFFTAPEATARTSLPQKAPNMATVFRDRRFWDIAPLSALGVGSSWSLQSLWAEPCMRDVQGFDRTSIVHYLGIMAFAVCIGAPTLGVLSMRLRRAGIKTEHLLTGILSLSALAQFALILRWSLPPAFIWAMISLAGATTVLSYALIGSYYPASLSHRANGALNLITVVGSLVLQSATGLIFAQWASANGSYPLAAYQAGFSFPLVLQLVALGWYLASPKRLLPSMQSAVDGPSHFWRHRSLSHHAPPGIYPTKKIDRRLSTPTGGWPTAAFASTMLCIMLAITATSLRSTSLISQRQWISRHKHANELEMSSMASPKIIGKKAVPVIAGIGW